MVQNFVFIILLLRSFQPQQTKPKMKLICMCVCVSTNQNFWMKIIKKKILFSFSFDISALSSFLFTKNRFGVYESKVFCGISLIVFFVFRLNHFRLNDNLLFSNKFYWRRTDCRQCNLLPLDSQRSAFC